MTRPGSTENERSSTTARSPYFLVSSISVLLGQMVDHEPMLAWCRYHESSMWSSGWVWRSPVRVFSGLPLVCTDHSTSLARAAHPALGGLSTPSHDGCPCQTPETPGLILRVRELLWSGNRFCGHRKDGEKWHGPGDESQPNFGRSVVEDESTPLVNSYTAGAPFTSGLGTQLTSAILHDHGARRSHPFDNLGHGACIVRFPCRIRS